LGELKSRLPITIADTQGKAAKQDAVLRIFCEPSFNAISGLTRHNHNHGGHTYTDALQRAHKKLKRRDCHDSDCSPEDTVQSNRLYWLDTLTHWTR
jgi:catalase (peroxidase I)